MKGPQLYIRFEGRVAEGFGIALWQADGSGPEPAATGHRFVTPIETITAHYYVASRDHVDPAAVGGLNARELVGAWHKVREVLASFAVSAADLTIRLPLTTAGADREGEDWFYRDGVETRYLRPQAPLPLMLGARALLEFAPARLTLTEDYRGARNFSEVRLALASDPTPARPADVALSGAERALSDAFLVDLAGRPVRFVVDAIQLVPLSFGGNGRTSGRYAEIPAARLDVLPR